MLTGCIGRPAPEAKGKDTRTAKEHAVASLFAESRHQAFRFTMIPSAHERSTLTVLYLVCLWLTLGRYAAILDHVRQSLKPLEAPSHWSLFQLESIILVGLFYRSHHLY